MLVIDCVQTKQTLGVCVCVCLCVHMCVRVCMWPCVCVIFKQIRYFEVWSCWCTQVAASETSAFAFCQKYMVCALYHYLYVPGHWDSIHSPEDKHNRSILPSSVLGSYPMFLGSITKPWWW